VQKTPESEQSRMNKLFKMQIGGAIERLGFEGTDDEIFIINKKEDYTSSLQNVLAFIDEDGINTVTYENGKLTKRLNLNNL
jgi:hypothetical protein